MVPASFDIMHDVVTTPYWSAIARGAIVNEPMTKSKFEYNATSCSFSDVYYTRPYAAYSDTVLHSGHCWPVQRLDVFPTLSPQAGFEGARNKAIARAFAKAGGPLFSGLINLYQLPKLVQLIKLAISRLGSLWHLLKDRRRLVKVLGHDKPIDAETLSGLWLEWRYGWRPFILDVRDLCLALAFNARTKPERITYRATERFEYKGSEENKSEFNPIGATSGVQNCFRTSIETHAEYRAGIMLNGRKISVSQSLGTRFRDIPSAVWDAVPYSFVVDWFIGVANWLQSVSVDRGSILASWCTDRVSQVTQRVAIFEGGHLSSGSGYDAKAYSRSYGTATLTENFEFKSRAVNVSPPNLPVLDPKWDQATNLSHVLDAIGLLIQRLARLRK